jgi:hypothetical protein
MQWRHGNADLSYAFTAISGDGQILIYVKKAIRDIIYSSPSSIGIDVLIMQRE